jgi:hypothetical protein
MAKAVFNVTVIAESEDYETAWTKLWYIALGDFTNPRAILIC